MLKLHLAILWSGRVFLISALFCLMLLCIAMAFAGWLETPMDMHHAGWICLLLFVFSIVQIDLASSGNRAAIFVAMRQSDAFARGKFSIVFGLCAVFSALWCLMLAAVHDVWAESLWILLAMVVFSAIACHAMILNLEPNTVSLRPVQRHLLLLVVSGPWILPAWILGLLAGGAALEGHDGIMQLMALVVLGLVQYAIGALFRESQPNQTATAIKPEQHKP